VILKRFFPALILLLGLTCAPAGASARTTVLVSVDILVALVGALAETTGIKVVRAVPEGYVMDSHENYFSRHREEFFALAGQADAVVTVRSVWPDDPLFLWARRGNIRVVEIDAVSPVSGPGAGVPLTPGFDGAPVRYAWRSPANLSRMAAIVADDLARLSPGDASAIRQNLTLIQAALFRLRSRFETLYSVLPVEVVCLTDQYVPLLEEFGLDIVLGMPQSESAWTGADEKRLAAILRTRPGMAVVCAWEPGGRAAAVIADNQGRPVVLRRFVRHETVPALADLTAWMEDNLDRLAVALGAERELSQ